MNKLLLTSVLALSLVFPLVSNAGQLIFGVDTSADLKPVNHNVSSGYVAKSLDDTFVPQKLSKSNLVLKREQESNDDTYIVFGIDIKDKNLI